MYDVLGTDLQKIDTLEAVSSANYSVYWQEIGGITLIAAATPKNLALLENDRYIAVNDGKRQKDKNETVYLICNVAVNEEKAEITVNGKTVDYLLHGRGMLPVVLVSTGARDAAAKMVRDNLRGFPFSVGTMGILDDTQIIRYPIDGGAVDEKTEEFMKYCGIGKRVWLKDGQFDYFSDSGQDLTGAENVPVFGIGSGAARGPTIAIDTSDYCNVATATLTFNDDHTETVSYGDAGATGISRRELYCGNIMQESDEADAAFRDRAKAEAEGMLAEHIKRFSVSVDLDASDLIGTYQLGSIVRVEVGDFTLEKRITGIAWLKDQTNDRVSIKLGDPIMTVIAEIKEKKPTSAAVSGQIGGLRARATATEEKTKLIQEDYQALIAKVDGVVAGMDAYVLNKTFEDYKLAVTRTFATIEDVDAAMDLMVSTDALNDRLKNYALISALADYLTVKAAAETYVTSGGVSSIIGQYIVEDAAGNKKSLAQILADVITLQGDVNVKGNLTLTDGNIIALTEIIAAHGLTIGTDHITIYGKDYKPTPITSTTGAVLALGIA